MRVAVVDRARTRELRRSVLRPGRSIADHLPGDELPDAVHFGGSPHGEIFSDERHPIPHRSMWLELAGAPTPS